MSKITDKCVSVDGKCEQSGLQERVMFSTLGTRTHVLGGFQREGLEDHFSQLVLSESIKSGACKISS